MIRLAKLSIRFPVHAVIVWAFFAVVLSAVGLGVSHSLSPSMTVVPGASRRAPSARARPVRPVRARTDPLGGPGSPARPPGPQLVAALAARPDTRVMSAWSDGETGGALRPSPDAAMIVPSVAKTESRWSRRCSRRSSAPSRARTRSGQGAHHRPGDARPSAQGRGDLYHQRAELIAVGILFVLLLIGLRTPVAASCSPAFGAVTTLTGFGAMALLGQGDRDRPARRRARLDHRARARRRLLADDRRPLQGGAADRAA